MSYQGSYELMVGNPCSLSKHPREHAQKPVLRPTTTTTTSSLSWLPCIAVPATRPRSAQPPWPTHPAPAAPPGASVADDQPGSHLCNHRLLPFSTLRSASSRPSEQEVPSSPKVAAVHPETHPARAGKPQDIQQPRHLDMWQLSRAVQRPGRHAGAQEKLLQNEIHMQVRTEGGR